MALDKFTQITKSGIVTTINFECHHLYSTGIATFSSGNISAVDGTFTGDVSIGGTLTYQDVTNIDSVGLVTARLGLNVTAGVSTFADLIDANGGVDISGGSGLVASTAKISDLTDNRVVIGGSSGELEDSANLTFDGSNLGVGSKVTVTNANADSRNVNSLGADINAAWIRIGDKAAAKTFSNGLGIKFYDQGTAHWSTGTIGNQYYVSYTGSAGDELFPSSRVDALTFNTTGAAVFASDITAGGNLYIPDKIYHSGDTDTFISFPAANTVTVETAGSERLRVDANGDLNLGDNPTNTYGYKLNIQDNQILYAQTASSSGTELKLYLDHGNTIANFGTVSTSHLAFVTANTERLRINSSGHVGVNTDFTGSQTWRNGQRLEIFGGGGNVTGELHLGANRGDSNQSVGSINFFDNSQDSTHRHIALIEADKTGSTSNKRGGDLIFFTKNDNVAAPTEKIRITSAGLVGINRTSPNHTLEVGGNVYITSNTTTANEGGGLLFQAKGGGFNSTSCAAIKGLRTSDTSSYLVFETGGTTERLRIASDSNITQTIDTDGDGFIITTGSANIKPMLTGNSNRSAHNNTIFGISGKWNNTEVGRIAFEAGADTTNKDDGNINLYTRVSGGSLTSRLRINSSGYVGVKRSTPLANLHVTNNELAIGANPTSAAAPNATYDGLVVDGEAGSFINIRSRGDGNSAYGRLAFSDDVRSRGYLQYTHDAGDGDDVMLIATAGSERLRITSSGQLLVGTTSSSEQFHFLKSHNGHTRAVIQNNWGANATAQLKLVAPTDELQMIKYASGAAAINLSNNSTIYASIGGSERLKIRGDSTGQTTHIVNTPSPGGNGVQSQYVTQPYGMSGNYTNFRVTVTASSWHSFFLKFYVSGYSGDAAYRWVTGYCNNGFGTIRHVHSYDGGDFGSGTLTHISGQSWRYDLSVNSNSVTHPVMHVELSVAGNGNVLGNGAVVCAIT